jgi:hypothetical protein
MASGGALSSDGRCSPRLLRLDRGVSGLVGETSWIRFPISNSASILQKNRLFSPKEHQTAHLVDFEAVHDDRSTANTSISAEFAGLLTVETFLGNLGLNRWDWNGLKIVQEERATAEELYFPPTGRQLAGPVACLG